MAAPTTTYAPDDFAEVNIADVPAEGLVVQWRSVEILASPTDGVLALRTPRSGVTDRLLTGLYADYEHVLQVNRIMPAAAGTTVTRVRGWA